MILYVVWVTGGAYDRACESSEVVFDKKSVFISVLTRTIKPKANQ